jgi:hypothetical protein
MYIDNDNPITPGKADKLWVTRLVATPGQVIAYLQPYDGNYLVGGPAMQQVTVVTGAEADTLLVQAVRMTKADPAKTRAVIIDAPEPEGDATMAVVWETDKPEVDGIKPMESKRVLGYKSVADSRFVNAEVAAVAAVAAKRLTIKDKTSGQ